MAIRFTTVTLSSALPRMQLRAANSWGQNFSVSSQLLPQMRKESRGRRVWRRRKLVSRYGLCAFLYNLDF